MAPPRRPHQRRDALSGSSGGAPAARRAPPASTAATARASRSAARAGRTRQERADADRRHQNRLPREMPAHVREAARRTRCPGRRWSSRRAARATPWRRRTPPTGASTRGATRDRGRASRTTSAAHDGGKRQRVREAAMAEDVRRVQAKRIHDDVGSGSAATMASVTQ